MTGDFNDQAEPAPLDVSSQYATRVRTEGQEAKRPPLGDCMQSPVGSALRCNARETRGGGSGAAHAEHGQFGIIGNQDEV